MFSLVYYSQVVSPFNEESLYQLAALAHKKNKRLSLTGFLQYKTDHFLQYLEGAQDDVLDLMDTIKEDPRHVILRTVYPNVIALRRFDNWHMRYWKESEFKYFKLVDLLDKVLITMNPMLFGEDVLRERTTKLVDLMSDHQHFIKELE